jgi:exopolysaccharide production protein ExoZ
MVLALASPAKDRRRVQWRGLQMMQLKHKTDRRVASAREWAREGVAAAGPGAGVLTRLSAALRSPAEGCRHMPTSPSRPTLLWLQALRAIAALAVVVAHTHAETGWYAVVLHMPNNLPSFVTGAVGVDLFFVISGFVMVYSSEGLFGSAQGAGTFLLRRLLRIVPLYWLATLVELEIWHHVGATWQQFGVSWSNLLASLFFYPLPRTDGVTFNPILAQGWSLNYEMFFYLVFAVAVIFRPRVAITGVMLFLVALGGYTHAPLFDMAFPLRHFANPILWEFALGLVIGLAHREGLCLPRTVAVALMAAGFGVIIATMFGEHDPDRFMFWAIPSALIVLGAAMMPNSSLASRRWQLLALLGDSSYAIYLTHGQFMGLFRMEFPGTALFLYQWPWFYWGFIILGSAASGCLVHLIIERSMTRSLKMLVMRHRPGLAPGAMAAAPVTTPA